MTGLFERLEQPPPNAASVLHVLQEPRIFLDAGRGEGAVVRARGDDELVVRQDVVALRLGRQLLVELSVQRRVGGAFAVRRGLHAGVERMHLGRLRVDRDIAGDALEVVERLVTGALDVAPVRGFLERRRIPADGRGDAPARLLVLRLRRDRARQSLRRAGGRRLELGTVHTLDIVAQGKRLRTLEGGRIGRHEQQPLRLNVKMVDPGVVEREVGSRADRLHHRPELRSKDRRLVSKRFAGAQPLGLLTSSAPVHA